MAYGKDAPFDRDDLAGWDMEKMLGWMVMNANFISTNARNGRTDCTPIIVKTCDGYYFQAGQKGDALVLGHALEVARKVYDDLYPPIPKLKSIGAMTEESEFHEQAARLNGYIETLCFGPRYIGVSYREGYGSSSSSGCINRTDAFRVALRLLAEKQGRYDIGTDTIKEA
jgi:hypothetical protein